jgi:hypothetical protein
MVTKSREKVLPNFQTCQFQSLLPSEEFLQIIISQVPFCFVNSNIGNKANMMDNGVHTKVRQLSGCSLKDSQ